MFERAHLRAAIAVSFGAIAGVLCRHYLSRTIALMLGLTFPWGTLGVNLSGCLLMGGVTTWLAQRSPVRSELVLLLTTGFLGSYTTFSTYTLELTHLAARPNRLLALTYGLGSLLLGLACLALGRGMATQFWPRCPGDRATTDESP